MKLSSKAIARAERIREMCRKAAYDKELRTGVAPSSFSSPKSLSDALDSFSVVRGNEAEDAAREINAASDPLSMAEKLLPNVNEHVLNYLVAQCSYKYFCLKYFSHMFSRGMCKNYHDPYFEICRAVETHRTDTPTIIAGPPDWGKTTIGAVMLPLHCVVFDNIVYLPNGQERNLCKRFIGLITVVEKNARRTLETIRAELESNELIRRDFGEFYRLPGSRAKAEPWSESVAVTLNERRIEIFGRKGKVRGAIWKGHRLDLPIGDDLEDDENRRSIELQERDYQWLQMLVNRVPKENGNVLILGNLVNPNGLLDQCVKDGIKNGWIVKVFKLYDIDPITGEKKYTWPEEFGEAYEKHKRSITGDENFEAEFLSNPEAYYREVQFSDIGYYQYSEEFLEMMRGKPCYAAADPNSQVTYRSDFMGISGIIEDPDTGIIYYLPPFNDRSPTGLHADVILDLQNQWNPIQFGVEAVAYQNALIDRLEERRQQRGNMYFNCIPIQHPYMHMKKERIAQRLYKRIKDKIIRFPMVKRLNGEWEVDRNAQICIDQIVNLKTTKYDDLADSLEMAVRLKDKDVGVKAGIRASTASVENYQKRINAPATSVVRPPEERVVGKLSCKEFGEDGRVERLTRRQLMDLEG